MEEEWILVFRAKDGPGGRWDRGELISAYPGNKRFRPAVVANANGNFAFVRVRMTREEVDALLEPDETDEPEETREVLATRRRKVDLDEMMTAREKQDVSDVRTMPRVSRARIVGNQKPPRRAILAPRNPRPSPRSAAIRNRS